MKTLRILIAALALVALVASLAIPAPGSFAIAGPAAILIFLLGFGSIAADALPLRGVPLVCSILTVLILVLQGVAWFGGRRLAVAAA